MYNYSLYDHCKESPDPHLFIICNDFGHHSKFRHSLNSLIEGRINTDYPLIQSDKI